MDAVVFVTYPNERDFQTYLQVLTHVFPGVICGQPALIEPKKDSCVML